MSALDVLDDLMARLGRRKVVIAGCEAQGDLGVPYMTRYVLYRRDSAFSVYLHVFHRSDNDRAMHDHPWGFRTLILWRGYHEVTAAGVKRIRPLTLHRRPAEWTHRVRLLADPCPRCAGYGFTVAPTLAGTLGPRPCRACAGSGRGRERPAVTLVFRGARLREWGFHMPRGWVHWTRFFAENGCEGGD